MRRKALPPLLIALLFALIAAGCGEDEQALFIEEYGAPPAPTPGLAVWVTTDDGSIWHSDNGGADWQRQPSEESAQPLYGVVFSDARHGWAWGENGLILATRNGGATWDLMWFDEPGISRVVGVDTRHVWAFETSGVLMCKIGAGTWNAQHVPGVVPLNGPFHAEIDFADAKHGWIVSGHAIRASEDGGKSWTVQYRDKDVWFSSLTCSDARHVWAVGTRSGIDTPVAIATTDGGTTWNLQPVFAPGDPITDFTPTSVACADGLHVWMASVYDGLLAASSDGGQSWKLTRLPANLGGGELAAADGTHVCLTTGNYPLLISGDGGRSWAATGGDQWLGDGIPTGVAVVHTTDAP